MNRQIDCKPDVKDDFQTRFALQNDIDAVMDDIRAIANTGFHRLCDAQDSGNPPDTEDLIGLFSAISRLTKVVNQITENHVVSPQGKKLSVEPNLHS